MDNDEVKELLEKYFSGHCTAEEQSVIERAYLLQDKPYAQEISTEKYEQLKTVVWDKLSISPVESKPKRVLWPRIVAVAAVLALMVLGVYFFNANDWGKENGFSPTEDIAPGTNAATLTLANGKKIKLSDAKTGVIINASSLEYNDGTPVDPSLQESNTAIVINTPRGGTYQVALPDGTKVWLNADSKLSFPSKFSTDKRQVILDGEAYFEVSKVELPKGHRMPFIVTSKTQTVEVLGTHFNVSSYSGERTVKTTLLEGSVRVNNEVTLKPNQQSVLTDQTILVKDVDVNLVVAWKNGDFMFKSESIGDLMKAVERWYDIDVVYQDDSLANIKFSGTISRSKNVSALLNILQTTGQVHFELKGKQIIVTK